LYASYNKPFNWSGFYFGVNGGGLWNETAGNFCPDNCDLGWATRTKVSSIAGLHAGFLMQSGMYVYGLEGGWSVTLGDSYSSSMGNNTGQLPPILGCGLNVIHDCEAQTKDIYYVGPRVGILWGPWQIYATGGYAGANIETRSMAFIVPPTVIIDSRAFHNGWYAGGGADLPAFNGNLIVGIDYKHYVFNSTAHLPTDIPTLSTRIKSDADALTLRLTIKTGG